MSRHRLPVEHRKCAYEFGRLTAMAVTTVRGINYGDKLYIKAPVCQDHSDRDAWMTDAHNALIPWPSNPRHSTGAEPDAHDPMPADLPERIVQAFGWDDIEGVPA